MTSGKVATTVGYERRNNPALKYTDRGAFVRFMSADQPVRPANIANIVAINQGLRPLTMEHPLAPGLNIGEFEDAQRRGAIVIDTRPSAAFAAGHVSGALNIHLSNPEFEQRVGWVAPPAMPLLLVLDTDERMPAAMHALAFVGLDARVEGFLQGGMDAWRAERRPCSTLAEIDVHDLHDRLRRDAELRVLDVREMTEWNAGHIEGSHSQSFRQLQQQIPDLPFDPSAPVAVICQAGARASTAASILQNRGFTRVWNVTGGMDAWQAAGFSVVDAAGCPIGGMAS